MSWQQKVPKISDLKHIKHIDLLCLTFLSFRVFLHQKRLLIACKFKPNLVTSCFLIC